MKLTEQLKAMKNNNKNRKLKFIREKNNLRLGLSIFRYIEKDARSTEDSDQYIKELWIRAHNFVLNKYKLKLNIMNKFYSGLDGDDFIENIYTNYIEICVSSYFHRNKIHRNKITNPLN